MDAVICFDEGTHSRIKILRELKLNPGVNTCKGLQKADRVRICEAEITVQIASKETKTIERQNKRNKNALEEFMQDEYKSGILNI
ncbi:hypothetical protein TNCV_3281011 [Trichonephila clavipes]|nr:hypothetical protein TNCV_3281011 [Trichonephila clavipes]